MIGRPVLSKVPGTSPLPNNPRENLPHVGILCNQVRAIIHVVNNAHIYVRRKEKLWWPQWLFRIEAETNTMLPNVTNASLSDPVDSVACNNEKLTSGSTSALIHSAGQFLASTVFQDDGPWPTMMMAPSRLIPTRAERTQFSVEVTPNEDGQYPIHSLHIIFYRQRAYDLGCLSTVRSCIGVKKLVVPTIFESNDASEFLEFLTYVVECMSRCVEGKAGSHPDRGLGTGGLGNQTKIPTRESTRACRAWP